MNQPFETMTYKGFTVKFSYSENAMSPNDWDNLGTIYSVGRDRVLQERFSNHFELTDVFVNGCPTADFTRKFKADYVGLPLWYYDHGELALKAGERTGQFADRWDSGFFGIIAVVRAKLCKEYGWARLDLGKIAKAKNVLENEIRTWNQYLQGDVYDYAIYSQDGALVDSLCSFYGLDTLEDTKSDIKSFIDSYIEQQQTNQQQ